ncbi:hypothetical protein [Anaerococcus hydrogenalis]|uniref:Conserved domain protein n=1 Tax=Anaerococcus hydrogenalis ACS-025-V-Sch4 TaxID=879306 RepID=F0H2A9_9FIRM|nr:hypothetical protein [Anaerococcus hydrogenalis]EGC83391.1 conserved domain protein [Anaerococcus hydrogenalis ACS-025-V-Sch4]
MSLNTLNLKQKQGGRVIKQADRSSTFKFALQDINGALINLNGKEADISLFNPNIKKYWSTKSTVKDAEVEFKLPGNIEENDYVLEISVGGYVFPSDNDFIIEVVKGFKDLPDMETGLRYKQTIEEITDDYIKRSDKKLKDNLNSIDNTKKQVDESINKSIDNFNSKVQTYSENLLDTYNALENGIEEISNSTKNLIDSTGNSYIALIGSKKYQALKDIDGQVKVSTDKYLGEYSKKLNDRVEKVPGKQLSDNNFTNLYKNKLDNLDTSINNKVKNKAEKDEVKEQLQEVKDLIFDNTVKYANDTVYVLDTKVESGEVKVVPKEIGKLVANDFLKVNVDSDKYKFRIKATSQGIILFYSMTDEALRYAIHVYPQIKDYEIDFGKKVTGEMIFTSVTMPEDKVSVIREEGV